MFKAFLLCALFVATTTAHLSAICSVTSASKAGSIDFYFGTYHNHKASVPGKVEISQPNVVGGAKLTGSFSSTFNAVTKGPFMISTPNAAKANLIAVTKGAVTQSSYVDCYVQNAKSAAMKPPADGQWIVPNPRDSSADMKCDQNSYLKVNMWAKLTIHNAKSGDWRLLITGTDQVYDPGKNQCSLGKSGPAPKWIKGMVVADGTPSCKGTPAVANGIDSKSVAGCKDLMGGAECNSWKCNSANAKFSGSIKCSKGEYKVTARCQPETACGKEANDSINQITNAIRDCQTALDGMSNGAKCANEMDKEVKDAKARAKQADDDAKKAHDKVAKHNPMVTFKPISLNSLSNQDCASLTQNILKPNSNYNDVKKQTDAVEKLATEADAKKKVANDEVKRLEQSQKDAVLKCQCTTKEKMDKAANECDANNGAQKLGWSKSHHLACIEDGRVTLDSKHQSGGQCKVTPMPTIKPKAMAFTLGEKACMNMKKSELEMGEEAYDMEEVAVTSIWEPFPKDHMGAIPKGSHMMPDGEIMADADMSRM